MNQSVENRKFNFPEKLEFTRTYEQYLSDIYQKINEAPGIQVEEDAVYMHYTHMNMRRMERLNKTVDLLPETIEALKGLDKDLILLTITENWCGDAAQVLPVVNKLSEATEKIEFVTILRDQHLDLMDEYLTNDARSIPKIVALEKSGDEYIEHFTWGPKPKPLMEKLLQFKNGELQINQNEFLKQVQIWYNKDKSETIQKELIEKLNSI